MKRPEREQALRAENRRLKAALSAVHDALHADEVNRAHALCETALCGGEATQPNIEVSAAAASMDLITAFNKFLASRGNPTACLVHFVPSSSQAGMVSIQIGGEVRACKMLETMLRGKPSMYAGDATQSED